MNSQSLEPKQAVKLDCFKLSEVQIPKKRKYIKKAKLSLYKCSTLINSSDL